MSQESKEINQHINGLSFGKKFKEFLKTPAGKRFLVIALIVLIVLGFTIYTVYNRYFRADNKGTSSQNKSNGLFNIGYQKPPEEKKEISKLDGVLYSINIANRHPLAVMIENHPDARPQSGLDKANVVYEAIAEGGITRFMAIFGPDSPEKIGPVRSARTYYLDWALEYDAFYAHVGGNIDALDLIPKIGIKDLDQFRYGTQAYWRIPQANKATEHTMYTSAEKLYNIASKNGWDIAKSDFNSLQFKDDLALEQRPSSQNISIDFSTSPYLVKWVYDATTNSYKREMAGIAHKDAISGEQLTAKNIIIQVVKRASVVTRINENGWQMTTVGEGKAKIIFDGKIIEGTWKKKDRNSRTLFYDPEGVEIKFDAGKFWYEIVPPETAITITNP